MQTNIATTDKKEAGFYASQIARFDQIFEDVSSNKEYTKLRLSILGRIKKDVSSLLKSVEANLSGVDQETLERRLEELVAISVPHKAEDLLDAMLVPWGNRKSADFTAAHSDDDTKIAEKLSFMAEKLTLQYKLHEIYTEHLTEAGPDQLDIMREEIIDNPSLRESIRSGGYAEIKLLAIAERKQKMPPEVRNSQENYDRRQKTIARIEVIFKDAEEQGMSRAGLGKFKISLRDELINRVDDNLPVRNAIGLLKKVGRKDAKLAADLLVKHGVITAEDRTKFPETLFIIPEKKLKTLASSHTVRVSWRGGGSEENHILDNDGQYEQGRIQPHLDDDAEGKWSR